MNGQSVVEGADLVLALLRYQDTGETIASRLMLASRHSSGGWQNHREDCFGHGRFMLGGFVLSVQGHRSYIDDDSGRLVQGWIEFTVMSGAPDEDLRAWGELHSKYEDLRRQQAAAHENGGDPELDAQAHAVWKEFCPVWQRLQDGAVVVKKD